MLDRENTIVSWLETVKDYRESKPKKLKGFSKNSYLLFFLVFKYLVFKDICMMYHKTWFRKYISELFIYSYEHRFYFILYHILLRNRLYDFVEDFTANSVISKDITYMIHSNHLIYLYTYLVRYLKNFYIRFNKNSFKYAGSSKSIFFFKDFKLKIDSNSFAIYYKYIEYFRISKYMNIYQRLKFFEHILN